MENINDIIKSGLLKRYVLGDINPAEKMKVEMLLIDQPAIRRAIRDVEISVAAGASKVNPSKHLKSTIIKQLPPAANFSDPPATTRINPWKNYLAYAAALLIGSLITWVTMNQKLNQTSQALESTEQELVVLLKDCNELSDMYAFIIDGATQPVVLNGNAFQKEADVVVYWNEEREKAMLRVVNLPSIASNQTYQIWADVDGEMLDLGTFEAELAIVDPIPINYLSDATSLNITIEPKGGSLHPTVATLTANKSI